MLHFYLGLNFESSYEFEYKAMPLVHDFIPVLKPVPIIDVLFSGIILKESSNDFKKVCFVSSVSFSIDYQVSKKNIGSSPNFSKNDFGVVIGFPLFN